MRSALPTVAILLTATVSCGVLIVLPETVTATTLFVGGGGPGNYTTIQDAIDNSSPGDTIYIFSGVYHENVVISKALNIIGQEMTTTVINGSGGGDVLRVTADLVNITRLTLENSGILWHSGLELVAAQNCRVSNITVSSNYYGIYLDSSPRNSVLNSTIFGNLGDGIYLKSSSNNRIIGNTVLSNSNSISLSSSHSNSMANNSIALNDQNGVSIWLSNNNSIVNNSMSGSAHGVYVFLSQDNTMVDNTILDNDVGVFLYDSTRASLRSNTMIRNGVYVSGNGLEQWNTHFIDTLNTIDGKPVRYWRNASGGSVPADSGQVILANCTNVIVQDSIIKNASAAVQLGFSSNNTIINITTIGNRRAGFTFESSRNNTISSAYVSGSQYGYRFERSSGNWLNDSSAIADGEGIVVRSSSNNNTITNNTVSLNQNWGVRVEGSISNSLFHNNFISNPGQAYDDSNMNKWNSTYPFGGNYWSDYIGSDILRGPNQDQPGADGIGDMPYDIQGGNDRDLYPLMGPFETIHPLPPVIQSADLEGATSEDVTLRWNLSFDDSGGIRSVIGYRVFRNTTYSSKGSGYALIATLPNGISEYVDNLAGEGDPNNYFYRVCAFDIEFDMRCSENQAGKFTHSLSKGTNLVSIPLIQSDERVQTILKTVSFDKVWSFDSRNQEWKSFAASKPHIGKLIQLNRTHGFWLNVTSDSNFTLAGVVPPSTSIHLLEGWNLISFPSFKTNYTVGDLILETNATRIETFSQMESPYHLITPNTGDRLLTGSGYWIEVKSQVTWTIDNE